MLTILVVALGLMVCQARVSEAVPMGSAFTYQGHLYDSNRVANDLYDFQFKLYDANSSGSQKGTNVNIPDVDVIDGYFTVELDFGSSVFNGDARWLEIGVRPGLQNDPCEYTPLSPRQKVTPTPYALHTRGIYVNSNGDVGMGTQDAEYGANLQVANRINIMDHSTSNPNLYIGDSGSQYIQLQWNTFGDYAQFFTPSAYDIAFMPGGNVGIGTTTPQGKLDVNGTIYQRGGKLHADYVFEPDYKLETIEEHSEFMWQNKHLSAIPKAKVDENGQEIVEVGSHRKGIVEELEKAHIYIEQLHERNKVLEERLAELEATIAQMNVLP